MGNCHRCMRCENLCSSVFRGTRKIICTGLFGTVCSPNHRCILAVIEFVVRCCTWRCSVDTLLPSFIAYQAFKSTQIQPSSKNSHRLSLQQSTCNTLSHLPILLSNSRTPSITKCQACFCFLSFRHIRILFINRLWIIRYLI